MQYRIIIDDPEKLISKEELIEHAILTLQPDGVGEDKIKYYVALGNDLRKLVDLLEPKLVYIHRSIKLKDLDTSLGTESNTSIYSELNPKRATYYEFEAKDRRTMFEVGLGHSQNNQLANFTYYILSKQIFEYISIGLEERVVIVDRVEIVDQELKIVN